MLKSFAEGHHRIVLVEIVNCFMYSDMASTGGTAASDSGSGQNVDSKPEPVPLSENPSHRNLSVEEAKVGKTIRVLYKENNNKKVWYTGRINQADHTTHTFHIDFEKLSGLQEMNLSEKQWQAEPTKPKKETKVELVVLETNGANIKPVIGRGRRDIDEEQYRRY